MRRSIGVVVVLASALSVMAVQQSTAQFKRTADEEPKVSDSFIRPETNSDWLGFFNPENFKMRQSYSMSYTSMGHQGLALGMYTNSMMYKFSNAVDAQVDVSLQHSPYSTFDQRFQNSLTGVFLNRAAINYRPADNLLFRVSYEKIPFGLYGMYGPYNGFFHGSEGY
jgi:hypothetical protein